MKRFKAIKVWTILWLSITGFALFMSLILDDPGSTLWLIGGYYLAERAILIHFIDKKFESTMSAPHDLRIQTISLESENWELRRENKALRISAQTSQQAANLPGQVGLRK